jgi:hypothetical protein
MTRRTRARKRQKTTTTVEDNKDKREKKDPELETSRRFQTSRREEKERCGAEPVLSERSESNGRLLELISEEKIPSLLFLFH